jgi:hypothetical protein
MLKQKSSRKPPVPKQADRDHNKYKRKQDYADDEIAYR